jgi:hypothetical protein
VPQEKPKTQVKNRTWGTRRMQFSVISCQSRVSEKRRNGKRKVEALLEASEKQASRRQVIRHTRHRTCSCKLTLIRKERCQTFPTLDL